ncbi:MAG: STAS domain-containing protein [Candidatus Eremiobacteraeota bacterium]|nr:STAS domain-containing protein [Candidatus Eremiobacteraeota bacterium]
MQTTIDVELAGDLDCARKDEISAALMQAAAADVAIVRLGHASFFDSTALGCLIKLRKTMQARNVDSVIILVDPPDQMIKVLEITGLRGLFRCDTSKPRAVASIPQSPMPGSQANLG